MHSLENQQFDMTGEYYTLHNYDLDSYDRRFAIIDVRQANVMIANNKEFYEELTRRCDLLKSQGFVFIQATPWESLENIKNSNLYPITDIEHVKWSGGVSWFWFYMYNKHHGKTYEFNHDTKKFDFLYLNKIVRDHRMKLFGSIETLWTTVSTPIGIRV